MGVSEDRDRHAQFDEFAVAAWPRLRWTAYLLCGDEHLAEDLAQTTLVKTYAAWRRVRRDEAYSFARRTLVNTNIDRLRRRHFKEVRRRARRPRRGRPDAGRRTRSTTPT